MCSDRSKKVFGERINIVVLHINMNLKMRDFLFIRRPDANAIINAAISLICRKLPDYLGISRRTLYRKLEEFGID